MIRRTHLPLWLAFGLALVPAGTVLAHDFALTDVVVVFKTNGTYQIDMTVDVDALALGVSPQTDSEQVFAELNAMSAGQFASCVEGARDTIRRRVRVRFDDAKQAPLVSFPDAEDPEQLAGAGPTVLGTTARLSGRIPEGARQFTFGASRAFKAVHLTILDQGTATGRKLALGVAEDSPPYVLGAATQAGGRAEVAARYLVLGFEHIVPKGLDHILFVLGLFLLSTRMRPLFWQVTAFTVAHSVTLALSMYEVVSLPPRIVESLIALSIAYVGAENLLTSELKPWRPGLVFGFGLLHGLGFAGVLRELGLPKGEYVTALVGFNVGVELGQLTVLLAAFLAVGWARQSSWYRARIIIPGSALVCLVGLYWAVQRAFGG